jgi:hypothetical protein|tara:strand:+ start:126 stop:293 length:168 start_codon:yes stop_codon:yes gene_type:complete
MSYLDDHPIAGRVVEQRIREAIHAWAVVHQPDVVEAIEFTMLMQLDKEADNAATR